MDDGRLVTPRAADGTRPQLRISGEEFANLSAYLSRRDTNWRMVVMDLGSGKRYGLRGAVCGLGCACDAEVTMVEVERRSSDGEIHG